MDENRRKKLINYFHFRFLLRKTRAGAETGYKVYGNGQELENLSEYIMI